MRDFRDAKAMASSLREALKDKLSLGHSEALEIVARQFNLADWNVLSAKIKEAEGDSGAVRLVEAVPILRIFDIPKARDFYLTYLGFQVDWEHRFGPEFPLYMQVSRAGLDLHLSEHHGDSTPGQVVYVRMQGLRAFHAELHTRPGHGMNPGIDEDAPGGPTMSVTDPFGNRLRFAENATRRAT